MQLLHKRVSARAQAQPQTLALVFKDTRVTYEELERVSNRIARRLLSAGVRAGDRVCLLTPKSPRAIQAILGILKTGAMYVPLDPDSPATRLHLMLASCDTPWLLASHRCATLVDELHAFSDLAGKLVVGWLDDGSPARPGGFSWDDVEQESGDHVATKAPMDTPAYILFTSGSTGVPKGVVITHANVAAFLDWALPYFDFASGDRLSGHPPLHFDLSVFDVFGALTAGATLHLVPPELNLVPGRLVRLMSDNQLTQWFSVPGVLSLVAKFDLLATAQLPALKRVLWCGEALPTPTLRYWMERLPAVAFTNLYGPTEATIASSYFTVTQRPASDSDPIPIGTPCAGEELLVLDESLQPVAPGVIGDLHIAGAGLSPGYWRDPDKTRAVFLPDPRPANPGSRIYRTGDLARMGEDGLCYFIGRADTQVKSRGYRIELGEIDNALNALSSLREGAVVAIPSGGFDGAALCCAYVPQSRDGGSIELVKQQLAARLPHYMIPSRWKQVDGLPRNANGKIDRRAIEGMFRGQT
jgi:amino acid adenylation domain-containing protein